MISHLLFTILSSLAGHPAVVDFDRRVIEPVGTAGRCERVTIRFSNQALFARGTLCSPFGRDTLAAVFWSEVGTSRFWHPNGQKLAVRSPNRTRFWASVGTLVAERERGIWRLGPSYRQVMSCHRGETLEVRGPKLIAAKHKHELVKPFTIMCMTRDGAERVLRVLWPNGAFLFDGQSFFHPTGELAMEVAAPGMAGHNGTDMKPVACFGRQLCLPCPRSDSYDWFTAGMYPLRSQGRTYPDLPLLVRAEDRARAVKSVSLAHTPADE